MTSPSTLGAHQVLSSFLIVRGLALKALCWTTLSIGVAIPLSYAQPRPPSSATAANPIPIAAPANSPTGLPESVEPPPAGTEASAASPGSVPLPIPAAPGSAEPATLTQPASASATGMEPATATSSDPLPTEPVATELDLFKLEEQIKLFDLKIVTASKSEETFGEAPASVTVLTYRDIRSLGVTTLEELLNYVPGFQATRDVEQGTAHRIGVRGRAKFNSEYVLFLINGQRINDMYTGGVTLLNRYITVDNIKQIEVIRGPGSALYGSGAFLGVVNIITFSEDQNNLTLQYGTMNARAFTANLSQRLGPVSLYGFARYYADDGFQFDALKDAYGHTGASPDPVHGIDVLATLRWRGLSIQVRHTERHLENFLPFGVLNSHNSTEDTRQTSINATYDWDIHPKVRLSFSGGFLFDHFTALYPILEGTQLAPGLILDRNFFSGPLLDTYQLSLGTSLRARPIPSNELSAGLGYDRLEPTDVAALASHDTRTVAYLGGPIVEFRGDASFNVAVARQIFSTYLQDKQNLGKWVHLTAGVRLDYYSDFGLTVNPRAALVLTTPIQSAVKFIYGKAFRAPNFLEFYDRNNPVDFGNRNLRPEDVHTFEVSYTQSHRFFFASLNYFHNIILNNIDYGPPAMVPENIYQAATFENKVERQDIDGLESEFTITPLQRPRHELRIRGTLTYLFNADSLPMPPLFGSFAVGYRVWRIEANVNGIFRQRFERLPTQDAYVVLNANLIFQVSPQIKLQALFKNLLNQQYLTATVPLPDGVPNRGFTFLGSVRFDY